MKILIIIPAYNEAKNLETILYDINKYPQYDYVIINDGSNDETMDICKKNKWHVINLPINLGIGGAVQTGYKYALYNNYDIAVQVDGDGQHDVSFILNLIEPLISGEADIVIGSRFINNVGFRSSPARRLGINVFMGMLFLLSRKKITDATSGFRAVNRKVIKLFSVNYASDYPEPESVMFALRNKQRIIEIPIIMRKRQSGFSSISSFKSLYYMVKVSFAILLCAIQPKNTYIGDDLWV